MKTKLTHFELAFALTTAAFAQEKDGNSTFSPAQLNERTIHRCAVESV